MVLRFNTQRHTASIATGTDLQNLTPPAGGDISGNVRYLKAIVFQEGIDMQRVVISSPDWGPRTLEAPPVAMNAVPTGRGNRVWILPHLMRVGINQTVSVQATQDSIGAQTETVDLEYLEGDIPAGLMATVGKLTSLFMSGTANNGSFANVSDTQRIEQEAQTSWAIIQGALVGADNPLARLDYPTADGRGPEFAGWDDVFNPMFKSLVPLHQIPNGDTVSMSGQDSSGGQSDVWLTLLDVTSGAMPERFDIKYGNVW